MECSSGEIQRFVELALKLEYPSQRDILAPHKYLSGGRR